MNEKKHTMPKLTSTEILSSHGNKTVISLVQKRPSDHGSVIAFTVIRSPYGAKTIEEAEENAKFLASAPDLLAERDALREEVSRLKEQKAALIEACEEMLATAGCSDDVCDHIAKYGCDDCCHDGMRRAVAKARGEE